MELKIESGDQVRTIRSAGTMLLVGTHESAEVRLADALGVNRRHALLVRYLSGWVVHDLASVNGIKHNSHRVRRASLVIGDVLKIGSARITVMDDGAGSDSGQMDDWAAAILGGGATFAAQCILHIAHNGEKVEDVEADGDRLFGYSSRVEVKLPRLGVSSLHCLLAHDNGSWCIHDLHSDGGLKHNNLPATFATLSDGDTLQIGELEVTVELRRDAAEQTDAGMRQPTPVVAAPSSPPPQYTPPSAAVNGSFSSASNASVGSLGSLGSMASSGAMGISGDLGALSDAESLNCTPQALDLGRRGRRALEDARFGEAVQLLQHACRLSPWTAAFRIMLRGAQKLSVRRPASEEPAQKWKLMNAQWGTWRAIRSNKPEKALRRAEIGLTMDPWNRGLLLMEALIFEKRQHFDLAVWAVLSGRARNPQDPHLNRPAARLLHHLGEYDKAVQLWKLVANAEPESREADDQIKRIMVDKTMGSNRSSRRND